VEPRDRDGGGEGAGGRGPGGDRDREDVRDPERDRDVDLDLDRVRDPAPAPAPSPPLTLSAVPLLVALPPLFLLGTLAQSIQPAAGLAWTQLFAFLVPSAALAARAGVRPASALRLGAPPPGALGLAALAGAAAFLAGGALMALWAWLLPPGLARTLDVARLMSRPGWELPVMVGSAALLLWWLPLARLLWKNPCWLVAVAPARSFLPGAA